MTSQDNFAVRFAKHKDELEWLFMELYHNREGLEVLEREMAEAYNARSAELKALDKATVLSLPCLHWKKSKNNRTGHRPVANHTGWWPGTMG